MSKGNRRKGSTAEEVAKKGESVRTDHTALSDSGFSKSVCSATDCTGLIPALPSSDAELEAYEEMYQFCLENTAKRNQPADNPSRV